MHETWSVMYLCLNTQVYVLEYYTSWHLVVLLELSTVQKQNFGGRKLTESELQENWWRKLQFNTHPYSG